MKKYNFDEVVDRRNTDSLKWDGMQGYYNTTDLIPMWVADMDLKCCDEIIEALTARAQHGIYGYGVKFNDYYEAIIGWYRRRHNLELTRKNILYMPNVVTALRCIVSEYTELGDGVALLSPVYGPFNKSIEAFGRKVNKCALVRKGNSFVIDYEKLEKTLQNSKVLFFCSPHNPVGRVWTIEELEKVGNLCLKHNVLFVCDEIHCDLVQKEHKFISALSLRNDISQNAIVFTSVSKTFNCAGLMGATALALNSDIIAKVSKPIIDFNLYMTNVFTVAGVKAAYNYGDIWVDEVVDYIGENYKYMCDFIKKNLPEIEVIDLQGSYLTWLDCHGIAKDEEELKRIMEQDAKVAGELGSMFGEEGYLYYRLNLATRRAVIEDTMNRIYKAVKGRK